jgi:arsenate reductase-like glutaredoxin family protein
MVRFVGWKYVESQYVNRFATNFSEEELQELLALAKKPLMKKLLRSQIQAYEDTGEKRAGLLWKFWQDYNEGNVGTPPNFLN